MKFVLAVAFFILISLCVEEACSKEKSSKKGKGKKKQYLCPSYVLHVLYSYMEKYYCIFHQSGLLKHMTTELSLLELHPFVSQVESDKVKRALQWES